jgi:hypothetical protein
MYFVAPIFNILQIFSTCGCSQAWESGRVKPVLPRSNRPGYRPGRFYMGRVHIRIIVR